MKNVILNFTKRTRGKYKKNVILNCRFWQEWSVSKLVLARAAMSRSSRQNTRLIQNLQNFCVSLYAQDAKQPEDSGAKL